MPGPTSQRVASVLRSLGSLVPGRRKRRDASRLVRPWRADSERAHATIGLTPSKLMGYLQAADGGSPQMQFELFGEMLQKWPRLAAVEATRRLALTGLAWEITATGVRGGNRVDDKRGTIHTLRSAGPHVRGAADTDTEPRATNTQAGGVEARGAAAVCGLALGQAPSAPPQASAPEAVGRAALAQAAAEYCTDILSKLDAFEPVLDHLANAIGYGIAIAELVWERGRLVDLAPVPYARLIADPHEPWRLRVLTEDEPSTGVPLDEHPGKWLVHRPRVTPGRPFEGGLLRASVLLFLAQNLSFKDWVTYAQIAGMPVRVAQCEPGTSEADQQQLLAMLRTLNTDAVAVLGKNVELKFIEGRAGGARPYQPLQEYCNTEVTILWLGQHLTTDLRQSGSRAAAEIHDRVREDLLVDDIADEGATITRDLLRPLVQARFGDGVPAPRFRRSLIQSVDTRVLADTLAVAVNELGLAVPREWVHSALGIPQARGGEATLEGKVRA